MGKNRAMLAWPVWTAGTCAMLLLVGGVRAQAGYVEEVLKDNPVGYWRLGEADIGEPLKDSSGHGLDGVYDDLGNPGLEAGFPGALLGDPDTSVQFSTTVGFGCGDCGQGVLPVGGPLDLGTTDNASITLEAWFKILPSVNDSLPGSAFNRIFHYNNFDGGQYAFGIVGDNNAGFPGKRTVFGGTGDGVEDGISQGVILAGPTDAIEPSDDEVWHHLVALLDKSDVRLFLDGEELQDLEESDPIFWQAEQATIGGRTQSDGNSFVQPFPGLIDELAIYGTLLSPDRIQAHYLTGVQGGTTPLQAGDADQDLDFDQFDLILVQQAAKYLTGQPATWGEGDWDGAPGGEPGNPPTGDGLFNQVDIIASLAAGVYLTGPYGAVAPNGQPNDAQTSVVYNASTGELAVDAPAGTELTSINIDSAAGIFTGDAAQNLGGSFDHDADNNIFKATFGDSFGSLSFGQVAQPGLAKDFVANDLTVVGSLSGGGDLGQVDLIYVPEPSSLLMLCLAGVGALLLPRQRQRQRQR